MIVVNREGNKVNEIRFKNGLPERRQETWRGQETCQISACGLYCWRCPVWLLEKQCIRNDRLDKPIGEEEKIYIRDAKAS